MPAYPPIDRISPPPPSALACRSNLDPWSRHGDSALWDVLSAVKLKAVIRGSPGGLDTRMQEAGDNLSVGQRQLFCLAR